MASRTFYVAQLNPASPAEAPFTVYTELATAQAATQAAVVAEATAIANEAAVTSAINAAIAIGTGNASVEVLAVQTAFNALKVNSALASTAVTAADTAVDAAGVANPTKTAQLILDMAVVTTKTKLDKVLEALRRHFDGNNELTP